MKVDNKNYIDITEKYLKNKNTNESRVEDLLNYEYNGVIYKVDGKNVVLDYSEKEREVAEWLAKTFGCIVKMVPRVNFPKQITSPDYILNQEKWDLKCINENATSKIRAVDNLIKNSKKQTENIILDITDSNLSVENILWQVKRVYLTNGREWINKILVIKNYKIIHFFSRNKKRNCPLSKRSGKSS